MDFYGAFMVLFVFLFIFLAWKFGQQFSIPFHSKQKEQFLLSVELLLLCSTEERKPLTISFSAFILASSYGNYKVSPYIKVF